MFKFQCIECNAYIEVNEISDNYGIYSFVNKEYYAIFYSRGPIYIHFAKRCCNSVFIFKIYPLLNYIKGGDVIDGIHKNIDYEITSFLIRFKNQMLETIGNMTFFNNKEIEHLIFEDLHKFKRIIKLGAFA